jgi:hypothetical protein
MLIAQQLFLGIVMIGPWAALVVYDLVLYIFRAIAYEVPLVGGRARGDARPRAPSLTERPSGRPRRFSLARQPGEEGQDTFDLKAEATDARFRHISEESGEESSAT